VVHAHWLPFSVYDYFANRARVTTNAFSCPNKNRDGKWIVQIPEANPTRVRMGFYCLWGVPTEIDRRPRDRNYGSAPAPWDSPQRTTDSGPYHVLLADIIESGTTVYEGFSGVTTSAPHTRSGPAVTQGQVPPQNIGSEGGNVGQVDGSVAWRRQSAMLPRYVLWGPNGPSSGRTAYW
jgi:hypothetical protein